MKSKFSLILCGGLLLLSTATIATSIANRYSENDSSVLENIEALSEGEAGGKGTLMTNQAGTFYCCCPGTRDCSSPSCSSSQCR